MTIRANIVGGEAPDTIGWVEVAPFDYHYDGPDPNGEIEAYLSGIENGSVTFSWPPEDDVHIDDYAADLKLIEIKERLEAFDPVWFVDLPDDFDVTTITYG